MIKFLILGCGSATPTVQRNPSGFLLQIQDDNVLIDCGEGTQLQLRKLGVSLQRISTVLISHMHADHYLGLFGMLSTLNLLAREKPLKVIGPTSLKEIIDHQCEVTNTKFRYTINYSFTDFDESKKIIDHKKYEVYSFPVDHSIECCGFTFIEKPKLRKLIPRMLEEYKVPKYVRRQIAEGEDFVGEEGEVIKNSVLTRAGDKELKFSFITDSRPIKEVPEFLRNSDLLYHESTFLHELLDLAIKTKHSTSTEAGEFAAKAEAKILVLGHYSSRFNDLSQFKTEAQEYHKEVILSVDGKEIVVK